MNNLTKEIQHQLNISHYNYGTESLVELEERGKKKHYSIIENILFYVVYWYLN